MPARARTDRRQGQARRCSPESRARPDPARPRRALADAGRVRRRGHRPAGTSHAAFARSRLGEVARRPGSRGGRGNGRSPAPATAQGSAPRGGRRRTVPARPGVARSLASRTRGRDPASAVAAAGGHADGDLAPRSASAPRRAVSPSGSKTRGERGAVRDAQVLLRPCRARGAGGDLLVADATAARSAAPAASRTGREDARRPASYRERAGDSLWRVAVHLLGSDATSTETAREVTRLWELNESASAPATRT